MSGNAISGFVDGFFKGRDWRERRDDRKARRERQDRLDKINLERHELDMSRYNDANRRANEAHGVRMDETTRQRELREEEEAFLAGISQELGAVRPDRPAAHGQGYQIGTPVGERTPPSDGTAQQAIPRPQLGFGAAMPQEVPQEAPVPAERAGSAPAAMEKVGLSPEAQNQSQPAAIPMGAMPVAEPAGKMGKSPMVREVDPDATSFQEDWQGIGREGDIAKALSQISTRLATGGASPIGRGWGAVKDYFTASDDEGEANAQSRQLAAEAMAWYQSDEARAYFDQSPSRLYAAQADPVAFYQSKDSPALQAASERRQPETMALGAAPTQGSAPNPAPQAPAGPVSAPVAGSAPEQAAAASVQTIEREAMSFGLRPGENFTNQQMDRGSKAYVDRYYETVVPQMVEFYTKRGELDKAQAYMELVESRQGRAAMRGIGRATFKVVNGDYDGAATDMLGAFKEYGIADQSMDVDEEATGVIRDDSGRPIGGQVVFVDRETGNRFEKTFQSPDDFIEYGHLMVNPASVAEMIAARRAPPKGAVTQQDILKAASDLMKASNPGTLTMEQAIGQVTQSLGSLGISAGAGLRQPDPPLYRPAK